MTKIQALRQIIGSRDPVEMQQASIRARRRNRAKRQGPLDWMKDTGKNFERPDWWDK